MTSRTDGRFQGDRPATRYEVAQAVANAMAELNNRLIAEGRNPEELVPYIERINLYVADEIDHLKQAQKELRATVNELLERMERREACSAPLPPACPKDVHPHTSTVPFTELRKQTRVTPDQSIHPVEGAATVHEATAQQFSKLKTKVSDGKIRAVEGAAPVIKSEVEKAEDKKLTDSFEKRISTLPSDESAWQHSTGTAKDEADAAKPEDGTEAVAADESNPDIGTKGMVPGEDKIEDGDGAGKVEAPAKSAEKPKHQKHGKKAKSDATAAKTGEPMQTSARPAPRSAPSHLGGDGALETGHGAVVVPEGAPQPFAVGEEHDASPVYPGTTATAKALKKAIQEAKATGTKKAKGAKKKSKKAKEAQVAAKSDDPGKADAKPLTVASATTSKAPTAEEVLGGPEVAQDVGGPTDEQLSNWKPTENGTQQSSGPAATPAPVAAAVAAPASSTPSNVSADTGLMATVAPPASATPVVAAAVVTGAGTPAATGTAAGVRTARAAEILAQLRSRVPAKSQE